MNACLLKSPGIGAPPGTVGWKPALFAGPGPGGLSIGARKYPDTQQTNYSKITT